jgi:hypothetical protein
LHSGQHSEKRWGQNWVVLLGGLVGGLVGGDVGRLVLGENVHEEEFESYFLKALRSSDMAASADIEAVHIAFT